jgi:alkylation response protein AidB-like acyl-CoA dehydrogenase
LIGVDLPEEYGGLGQSGVTSGLITEEIAYGDFNISYLQLLGSLMGADRAPQRQPRAGALLGAAAWWRATPSSAWA